MTVVLTAMRGLQDEFAKAKDLDGLGPAVAASAAAAMRSTAFAASERWPP
jgi:hypothetical protein